MTVTETDSESTGRQEQGRPMRLCHFCATSVDYPYFRYMARGVTEAGHQLTYATLGDAPPPSWLATFPGVEYFCLGARTRREYATAVVRLARRLRRDRVEILQTHLFDAGAVGIAAGRLARVPVVVLMRHHLDQHQLSRRPLHIQLDRLMALSADHVVVPSNAVRDHMASRERLDARRIEVVHLGIDRDSIVPDRSAAERLRHELGVGEGFLVGAVGRLDPDKGLSILIAAAKLLSDEIDRLKVVIIGDHPDPTHRRALEHEIAALGLERDVALVGYKSNVATWMQAIDVLAHPSLSDAFPQVVLEAMSVGTPVVATRVGGIPEMVVPSSTGALVPPRDADALAAAILRLYRDPELRKRYSHESERRIREQFSAARMVRHYLDRYPVWLAESRGRSRERANNAIAGKPNR